MQRVSVSTLEYEMDVAALLLRRLRRTEGGAAVAVLPGANCREAVVTLGSEEERDALCEALCALLLHDAANFELARIVNDLPFALEEKQQILPEAIRAAHAIAQKHAIPHPGGIAVPEGSGVDTAHTRQLLRTHFDENDHLNLEGFLRFRMQDALRAFELFALCAAEDYMLQTECLELARVLSMVVRMQPPRLREVSLILHADGSCTITDDTDARIECENCGAATGVESELVNLLVALAPQRIIVYDLSCGRSARLSEVLLEVFEGRVSFFR